MATEIADAEEEVFGARRSTTYHRPHQERGKIPPSFSFFLFCITILVINQHYHYLDGAVIARGGQEVGPPESHTLDHRLMDLLSWHDGTGTCHHHGASRAHPPTPLPRPLLTSREVTGRNSVGVSCDMVTVASLEPVATAAPPSASSMLKMPLLWRSCIHRQTGEAKVEVA